MGGNNSIEYAVAVSEKKAGESPVYRNPTNKDQLYDGPAPNIKEMKAALLHSCEIHAKNNCLGTIVRKEGQQDSIKYMTYSDLL